MACSIDHKQKVLNRYTNIFKSTGMPIEEAKQAAEERFNSIVNGTYGSTQQQEFIPDNEVEFTETLNSSNIEQVFNDLLTIHPTTNESQEHLDYLKKLLTDNVNKIFSGIDSINLKMKKEGNAILGVTDGKEIHIRSNAATIGNNVQMSVIQTFMHEIEHVKYGEYFNDPANKVIVDEVDRLWKLTKEHLDNKYGKGKGYRAFLHKDNNGDIVYVNSARDEIKAAKAQYNYIFNNNDTTPVAIHPINGTIRRSSNYLHEFAAFATTNEALRDELKDFKVKGLTKLKGKTFTGVISYLYDLVVNFIANAINARGDQTGDQAIDSLLVKLTAPRNDMIFVSKLYRSVISRFNQMGSNLLIDKIVDPLAKYAEEYYLNAGKSSNPIKGAAIVTSAALASLRDREKRSAHYNKAMDLLGYSFGLTGKNAVAELLREIKGYPRDFINKLNNTKRFVDQARRHVAEVHKKMFLELFDNDLNKKDSIAIKKVLLDLDLSSARNRYSDKEILEFLNDSTKLAVAIDQLNQEVQQGTGRDYGYMNQQINSLASYLATGNLTTDNNPNLNAHNIVRRYGYEHTNRYNHLEDTVDTLITLLSIQKLEADTKAKAFNKLNKHLEALTSLMDYHQSFKDRSLKELFNGVKTQTIKGYSSDLYNPSISIKISTNPADPDLLASGYSLVREYALGKDVLDPGEGNYLYINKAGGMATWNQQIVSMRNESIKGSSILHRMSQKEDYASYISTINLVKSIKASKTNSSTRNNPNYTTDNAILVPVYDEYGNIVDYRYLASKHLKDNVLEADNRLEEVFSRSVASITDKVNTRTVNQQTAKWLKQLYDKEFSTESYNYIQIHANSSDEDVRNTYLMLPKDFRDALSNEFGGDDKIFINKSYFNIVFGQRKINLFKKGIGKIVEDILRELTQVAKNNIVVKSSVVVGNVISNIILNYVNGVPIEYQLKNMAIALKGIKDYRVNYDDLIKARADLAARPATYQGRVELEAKIARLEDRLSRNPITPLIDAGLFQTIAEDIDPEQDIWNYRSKFVNWANPVLNKMPGFIKHTGRYAYITNDTKAYEILLKSTQYSDFMSRYALYKFRTEEEKVSQQDALEEINDDFINYEVLSNKYLQYLNDIGVVWFSKYFLRIQRIILRKMKKYPVSLFNSLMLQDWLLGSVSDITDSAAFINKNPLSITNLPFVNSLQGATTLNGLELII